MEELAMHLLDLLENSLEAGASEVSVFIHEDIANNSLSLEVSDNGKGMSPEMLEQVCNPFVTSRTTRRFGLGLSLLKATAEACGGTLQVYSIQGKGTTVAASMQYQHWDRPPLGDLASTLIVFLSASDTIALNYKHIVNERVFTFSSREIAELLDNIPLNHPQVLNWLRNYLTEGVKNISLRGEQNEIPGRS